MDAANQKTYTRADVIWHYAQLSRLQPAEQTILEQLRSHLPSMNMLDLGVGGGRTTPHFAPLAKTYVGIDSSAEMIAACQKRFAGATPALRFEVADARAMPYFPDQSFDFILFSFNGLDYVDHGDRQQILQEVKRLGRPGGYFCFSSHNLAALDWSLTLQANISFNPLRSYSNLIMLGLFHLLNWGTPNAPGADYRIVRDESHNFRLQTYYIRPRAQVQQLEPLFSQCELYSWSRGTRLATLEEAESCRDLWLYYLCRF